MVQLPVNNAISADVMQWCALQLSGIYEFVKFESSLYYTSIKTRNLRLEISYFVGLFLAKHADTSLKEMPYFSAQASGKNVYYQDVLLENGSMASKGLITHLWPEYMLML